VTTALVPDESRGVDGSFRPTTLMERVSRYLELFSGEGHSRKDIETNVSGKTDYIRQAIDVLVSEGLRRGARRPSWSTSGPPHPCLPRGRRGVKC